MKTGFAVHSAARPVNRPCLVRSVEVIHGQSADHVLHSPQSFPFMSLSSCKVVFCCIALFFFAFVTLSQTNYYDSDGTEYALVGNLPGDQTYPDVAFNSSGGFVVWQDNATDGSGWGISAQRLDSNLSGTLSTFRVNVTGTNDQENPHVTMLKNGGAAFVWQGGVGGLNQHIYARFMTPTNTWLTATDTLVSTFKTNFQISPAIATLNNSNVIVVWASYDQVNSSSLLDVYGQIFTQRGAKVGTNFLINQFTSYNQRSPAVAPLKNGGFVVAWISEQQRVGVNSSIDQTNGTLTTLINMPSVDVYARLYNAGGSPSGAAFLVSTDLLIHANPAIAVGSDGNYVISWSGKDMANVTNSWDIYARSFSAAGIGGNTITVNTRTYGDEYMPKISAIGTDYLIVWTSLGQDGDREGVYGRFVHGDGTIVGNEFRINSTWLGEQMEPAVASDGVGQYLAVWTSFTFSGTGFDLFAQRYANANAILQPMNAPYVYAPFVVTTNAYQPQLQVTWAPLQGIAVSNYQVYVDGVLTAVVTNNEWTLTAANGLANNSTRSFVLQYLTADGRLSPSSAATTGTTWSGCNYYGIPCEWMTQYYGGNWPSVNNPVVAGGPTLSQIFLSGGNPLDSSTWLVVSLNKTSQGIFVNWNTQPGLTYQLQATTDLVNWSNVGSQRFAAGASDSVYVGTGSNSYYRVILMR